MCQEYLARTGTTCMSLPWGHMKYCIVLYYKALY